MKVSYPTESHKSARYTLCIGQGAERPRRRSGCLLGAKSNSGGPGYSLLLELVEPQRKARQREHHFPPEAASGTHPAGSDSSHPELDNHLNSPENFQRSCEDSSLPADRRFVPAEEAGNVSRVDLRIGSVDSGHLRAVSWGQQRAADSEPQTATD